MSFPIHPPNTNCKIKRFQLYIPKPPKKTKIPVLQKTSPTYKHPSISHKSKNPDHISNPLFSQNPKNPDHITKKKPTNFSPKSKNPNTLHPQKNIKTLKKKKSLKRRDKKGVPECI